MNGNKVNNMNTPNNYRVMKLASARRYLLKIATSLIELDESAEEDDRIVYEVMNLSQRIEDLIKKIEEK